MRLFQFRIARALALGVGAMTMVACNQPPPAPAETTRATPAATEESQIKRGEMLVVGGLCHDCHTPKVVKNGVPEPDLTRALSGHPEGEKITAPFKGQAGPWSTHTNDNLTAWSGAWGVSFAANLTPDENTGLGIWNEDMFLRALKEGKHMGQSRPILPPMPWNWLAQLPEEDLKAMYAYLKSIPAIRNQVPTPLGPDGKPIEAP